MPEKSPDVWAAVFAWISQVAPHLYAPAMSVTIAVLRVIYGGGSKRQMALEGSLCGLVTLAIKPALIWVGLPPDMAVFIGALVGFIGVEKLRDLAVRFGERKATGQ